MVLKLMAQQQNQILKKVQWLQSKVTSVLCDKDWFMPTKDFCEVFKILKVEDYINCLQ